MKTNYDKIQDYLAQKGLSGRELEQAAYSATAKIEAIRMGIEPECKPLPENKQNEPRKV